MKTIKELSAIAGISIPTLRYYDEIGLLKPAKLSDAGYRLYDTASVEKLQQIMFFREMEIPLAEIKQILDHPDVDKRQVVQTQKEWLEKKRNHLNGIIDLITDTEEGVNTMDFELFTDADIDKIWAHFSPEDLDKMLKAMPAVGVQIDSIEELKEQVYANYKNPALSTDIIRLYGSKEKYMKLYTEKQEPASTFQEESETIYRQLVSAREKEYSKSATAAVTSLAELYKQSFHLDNARTMLLELAKELLTGEKLAQMYDADYGSGFSEYVAGVINYYYGV